MYTESELKQQVLPEVYQKARLLYMSANVQSLEIHDITKDGKAFQKIKAFVQGSGWRCYHADMIVDTQDNQVTEYACECQAPQKENRLCKHCTAALLRYIQVVQDQEKKKREPIKKITVELPGTGILPASSQEAAAKEGKKTVSGLAKAQSQLPKTDKRLYQILTRQTKEQQIPYRQADISGKVILEPNAWVQGDVLMAEFKIGTDHMYILRDLQEFVTLLKQQERKNYGTYLDFYHHMSAFTPQSAMLAELLVEMERANCLNNEELPDSYFGHHQVSVLRKRTIALEGRFLDQFMEAMMGKGEITLGRNMYATEYEMRDEEYRPKLLIEGVLDGIRLASQYRHMLLGVKYQYIIVADAPKRQYCYRILLEPLRRILSFRKYLNELDARASAFIAESDLPMFCRDLLPDLGQHYDLELKDFHPERYLPEPVRFEIYLDMPTFDQVTCRLKACYGEESYDVFCIDTQVSRFWDLPLGATAQKRDVQKELETAAAVGCFFQEYDNKQQVRVLTDDGDSLYDFFEEGIEKLHTYGEVYISEEMKKVRIVSPPTVSMGVSIQSGLLDLTLESEEMTLEQLTQILSAYDRKKKYYRLKDGSFMAMQEAGMSSLIHTIDELHLDVRQLRNGALSIPRYRALYLESRSREDGTLQLHRDKSFKQLVRSMKSVEDSDYEVPLSLQKIMREYQKTGYCWLKTLHENGFGGILADDMGLGKTLQVIAFLLSVKESGRVLIICPASLVYNWQSEIERFAPELHAVMVTGDAASRQELIARSGDKDILITSYDLLRRDVASYESLTFFCQIIDEAQFIKNHTTQAAQAVKLIRAGTRFALTGTPMENRLSELWSIFDYLMPGFLFSYKQFKSEIETPVVEHKDHNALLRLRRFITPFVLRRLKKDVLKDLPDKMEEIVFAKLEDKQRELYDANVGRLRLMVGKQSESEFRGNKLQVLAELIRLRQICCTPELVYENYEGQAAKVEVCMDLLHNAIEGGHKILLFSQFTSMLALLTQRAAREGISFYELTGQTSKEQRSKLVEAFNQDDTNVFFISLKAGGTGLNLTSADIVIHFDPWWNLAAQNQATDRTHRIGQKNVVTVYKLIAKHTIEEKIVTLQEKKQELADQVLGGENMDQAVLSKEDLLELLS